MARSREQQPPSPLVPAPAPPPSQAAPPPAHMLAGHQAQAPRGGEQMPTEQVMWVSNPFTAATSHVLPPPGDETHDSRQQPQGTWLQQAAYQHPMPDWVPQHTQIVYQQGSAPQPQPMQIMYSYQQGSVPQPQPTQIMYQQGSVPQAQPTQIMYQQGSATQAQPTQLIMYHFMGSDFPGGPAQYMHGPAATRAATDGQTTQDSQPDVNAVEYVWR